MLKRLSLRNFVLVDKADIELHDGLLALTGETGAGKSVVVGALSLIMGQPVRGDVLLDPEQPARLEASFAYDDTNTVLRDLCERHEVLPSDGEIWFTKEIQQQGSARSFACGRRVNAAVIRDFRDALIDFTSQREQVKLFDPEEQLVYLDTFGGLLPQRGEVEEAYHKLRRAQKKLDDLRRNERDRQARIDLYRYQAEEIDALRLQPGEDDELDHEYRRLSHAEEILKIASEAEHDLYESDNAVIDRLQTHAVALSHYADASASCGDTHSALQDAMAALDAAVSGLRSVSDEVSVDHERLDEVVSRLDALHRIKQKYSRDIDGILAYREEIEAALTEAGDMGEQIAALEREAELAAASLQELSVALTAKRVKQAKAFCKKLEANLQRLAMPHARCELPVSPLKANGVKLGDGLVGPAGADEVDLRFAANPGMLLQSLKLTASGGELSRVMLALKQLLAGLDRPKTVIFDEIDSGIGGRTADIVGEFIKSISSTHQVLCITHLPQVAAYGKHQLTIEKIVDGGASRIKIHELNQTERKEEIARMLSGADSTLALQHAEEILEKGAIGNHYD